MSELKKDLGQYLPVQKCLSGISVRELSDQELVSVILGTGTRENHVIDLSHELLRKFGGICGLSRAGLREIAVNRGMGLVKSIRLLAAFELGRRALSPGPILERADSPAMVWKYLLPEFAGLSREEFRVLVLNNKNHVLKKCVVSMGTISEALVHPREVFREAIREAGASIIIAHNHPSGILTPSVEDIQTTRRIKEAGEIIGICLLDHVIITESGYLSMREEGLL
ncbi:MAG: DNA repair protein RadC [Spirochaetes bacterium]|nr:DNA repair protein RadC [Spirochaetota bacterium]